jgi:hypothetical protein
MLEFCNCHARCAQAEARNEGHVLTDPCAPGRRATQIGSTLSVLCYVGVIRGHKNANARGERRRARRGGELWLQAEARNVTQRSDASSHCASEP